MKNNHANTALTMTEKITGKDIIKKHLENMPEQPGVYRMLGDNEQVLYVGKAKNLKKRVISYTRFEQLSPRLQRMVSETKNLEIITTKTEVEALLLESDLIKKLSPHYNILLKDDKSFPYIKLSSEDEYPRIFKYRGKHTTKGKYFGPFASAGAVNRTLSILQKAFLLRSCSDSQFTNRKRPCMLYQIKRCSAPCTDRINRQDYLELVSQAESFLSGHSKKIIDAIAEKMEQASEALEFETAAVYRDRINALRQIHNHKTVSSVKDADAIAIAEIGGKACIHVFFFRDGSNCGNWSFFPSQTKDSEETDILEAFISQFYSKHIPPKEIIINKELPNDDFITEALEQKAEYKVAITLPQRGKKKEIIDDVERNAKEALARKLSETKSQQALFKNIAEIFELPEIPERIEIYDNSHIQGSEAIGAMVVTGKEGFIKNQYRKFNIQIKNGDDYSMMEEMLMRRFKRLKKGEGKTPDLIIIDGGRGHLNTVQKVLDELELNKIKVTAISKGKDRNAGKENFHCTGKETFTLDTDSPLMYFLQRLRDEAHRFAITSHRNRRIKKAVSSPLDEITGIGAKRKKALLHYFGSAKAVAEAGMTEINNVDGINYKISKKIYDHFHSEE